MAQLISIFNNGVIGEEDSVKSTTGSEPTAERYVRLGAFLTFTINELRELGCYAASTGRGLEAYRSRLDSIAESRRKALQEEYEAKSAEPNDRLTIIQEERDALLAQVDREAKYTTEAALKCELARQSAHISGLLLEARADRDAIAAREQRRAEKERSEQEDDRLKDRIARSQTILEVLVEDRTANQGEVSRQATRLEERSKGCGARLQEVRSRIALLTEAGLTRTVAGFLLWGSSASLIGAGIAVTQLLQRALAAAETKREESLLLSWLKDIHSPGELLRLFASFMGVVVAAVAIIAAFTLLIRFLLRRFDPLWRSVRPLQNNNDEDGWAEWLEIFNVTRRFGGKGVTDYSLQQIVGLLPVVIAAAAVAFLFVAFGDRSAGNLSFVASQLGPAFLMLSLVSAALFITNILSAVQGRRPVSWLAAILFGLISVLPVLSLILSGMALTHSGSGALTAVTVAMTLSASGLAFGIIYRGQFIYEDSLENEIEYLETHIVALSIQPTRARILASMSVEDHKRSEWVKRSFARAFQQFMLWFSSLKFWERNRVLASMNDDAKFEQTLRRLQIAGDRLQEVNRYKATCEQLRSALNQMEIWSKDIEKAREILNAVTDRYRSRMRDLTIEKERALLELENAFHIANAGLGNAPPGEERQLAMRASAG